MIIKKGRKMFTFQGDNIFENYLLVFFGSFLYILGAKLFIQNSGLYAGGVLGIAQLLGNIINDNTTVNFRDLATVLFFMINVPIFIIGFKNLGKRFTILSFISVVIVTVISPLMNFEVLTDDLVLNAIFGGVIIGVGIGILLKVGASSGGTDIIAQYLTLKSNISFGVIRFGINASIVSISGILYGWEIALYTILNIYITTYVINAIHTRNRQLYITIITSKIDDLLSEMPKIISRDFAVLSMEDKNNSTTKSMIQTVVSSYELYNVRKFVYQYDSTAFINVSKSEAVYTG